MYRTLFVTLLLVVGLAGCASRPTPEPKPAPTVPVNVSVFLTDEATDLEKQAIQEHAMELPGVTAVTFVDREQAYERFKEQFKDDPDLLDSVRPESLPESFKVELTDPPAAEQVVDELAGLAGVDEVSKPWT